MTLNVVNFKKESIDKSLLTNLEHIISFIKDNPGIFNSFIIITTLENGVIETSPSDNLSLSEIIGRLEIAKHSLLNIIDNDD